MEVHTLHLFFFSIKRRNLLDCKLSFTVKLCPFYEDCLNVYPMFHFMFVPFPHLVETDPHPERVIWLSLNQASFSIFKIKTYRVTLRGHRPITAAFAGFATFPAGDPPVIWSTLTASTTDHVRQAGTLATDLVADSTVVVFIADASISAQNEAVAGYMSEESKCYMFEETNLIC